MKNAEKIIFRLPFPFKSTFAGLNMLFPRFVLFKVLKNFCWKAFRCRDSRKHIYQLCIRWRICRRSTVCRLF